MTPEYDDTVRWLGTIGAMALGCMLCAVAALIAYAILV
jgi:hypothetical protein